MNFIHLLISLDHITLFYSTIDKNHSFLIHRSLIITIFVSMSITLSLFDDLILLKIIVNLTSHSLVSYNLISNDVTLSLLQLFTQFSILIICHSNLSYPTNLHLYLQIFPSILL
jgi:hypothetical protein